MDKELLKQKHSEIFGQNDNIDFTYCPYRLCPLGVHLDYQDGLFTGIAINYGIGLAYTINENCCKIVSNLYENEKTININEEIIKVNDWSDCMRSAVYVLKKYGHNLKYGINAYMHGELPVKGIGSSTASIISFMLALLYANDIYLNKNQLLEYVHRAESEFLGLKVGILDPACEILCKKNELLMYDVFENERKNVPHYLINPNYQFLIIDSGLRDLESDTRVNEIVDLCHEAAYEINLLRGIENDVEKSTFREIDEEFYKKCIYKIPFELAKKGHYYYIELEQATECEIDWGRCDMAKFGRKMAQAGLIEIDMYSYYEFLYRLDNAILEAKGVFGARPMNFGRNGFFFALINSSNKFSIMHHITKRYEELIPDYKDKLKFYFCDSADGVFKQLRKKQN